MKNLLALSFTFFFLNTFSQDTITVIGVGDIMMGTNYPENDLPPDDGAHELEQVESILQNADVTFGNLEGTLLDKGGSAKTCKDPSVCYVFRTPTRYVKNLQRAGFDVMSIANNHAGDFGDAGRNSTMKTLDDAGISCAGQLQRPFTILERGGIIFGVAAFSPNNNCISVNDIAGAAAIIRHLDSVADIVIASFHGGAEGAAYQHIPFKHELFHGEDRGNVHQFAHAMIDAGADIVFGHGPHVTRAAEVYKNKFIAYSLGNFCTYGGINVKDINGLAPIIKVYLLRNGNFSKAQIVPTYQLSHTFVHLDPDKRIIKVMQKLTQEDFPNADWKIFDDGWIFPN